MLNIMIFRSLAHPSLFVLLCCFANFYVMGTTSSSLPFAFRTCIIVAEDVVLFGTLSTSLSWRMVWRWLLYYDYVLCCVRPYLVGGNGWIRSFSLCFWFMLKLYLFFFAWEVLLGNGILLLLLCIYFGWIEKARRGMYVCLISEGSSRLYMILMRAKSRTGTCELMWKNASKESQLIWLVMGNQWKEVA